MAQTQTTQLSKEVRTKEVTFDIQDLLPIAITVVVVGIGLVYGIDIVSDVKSDLATTSCPTGYTYNTTVDECYLTANASQPNVAPTDVDYLAVNNTLIGLTTLPNKLPTIMTIVVAAVIIGVLVRYLMVKF